MKASLLSRWTAALLLLPALAFAAPLQLPPVDVAAALAADAREPGLKPWRFAVGIPLQVTPQTHGQWTALADGRLRWTLQVEAVDARSLNFGFTRYRLPPSARLWVRSLDDRERHGPYDARHNAQGQLWTPVVRASQALIELELLAAEQAGLDLLLSQAGHGFRGFGTRDDAEGIPSKSGSCNIDVVCSEGDAWRDEIRSVARYTIGGLLLCTGQMVNNSAGDFTPYFLTANHCLTTAAQAPTTVFYWNYETSRCGGTPDGRLDQTQSGAVYLAGSGESSTIGADFTLLQLLSEPDPAFRVYYAGWDARDIAPIGVTGIHHPAGDEKRISVDVDPTFITAYGEAPDSPLSALRPTHLMIVDWDRGVTEGGSSGSGIWNAERRLVGQLSGGASSCEAPDAPDWYGRMYSNFNDVPTPLTSLGFWLDPVGGTAVLDGADPQAPSGGDGSGGGPSDAGGGGGGALHPLMLLTLLLALRRRARGR